MRKYTINRENLIKKEYNLLRTEELKKNIDDNFIEGELENFLFELFKIAKMKDDKSNENRSYFIMATSNIFTDNICIKIHIDRREIKLMQEDIIYQYIKAIKKIKSRNYTIEEISLMMYDANEDRVVTEETAYYDEVIEMGV